LAQHDRLNIAVFIDFDNIEIGVKTTLGLQFDVGAVLDAIKERGEVVTKVAYADWTRAGEYSRTLTQHAIRLVQRNLTPGGDKNGADINLALDALEMVFTHQHINAYVIVGGDSDFLSLVEKLKQYDKKVFVVGGRAFTSVILQRNCHEFIAYENIAGIRKTPAKGGRALPAPSTAPIAQAIPIVRRALKILADREVSPQTGLLKSTLLQLDSTFSERTYGASSFLDFTEKLAQAGVVQLKHSGRSVMVELAANGGDERHAEARDDAMAVENGPQAGAPPIVEAASGATDADQLPERGEPAGAGSQADGIERVASALRQAAGARWPMYLRNLKQIVRAADAGFDERRYGFLGLVDLARACQREGLVRLERDRRGGLRIFPGPTLSRPGATGAIAAVAEPSAPAAQLDTEHAEAPAAPEPETEPVEVDPGDALNLGAAPPAVSSGSDAEPEPETEPMPIVDPTAELLGTASRRGRGTRGAAAPGRRTTRAAGPARKGAARPRRPRSKPEAG